MSGQGSRGPPSTPPRDRFTQRQPSAGVPSTRAKTPSGKSASLPRILAGAAGLVAAKTFILDGPSAQEGGSVGLLILGFWGSRIVGDILALGGDRKGKGRAVEPLISIQEEAREAIMLAGQSIAGFATLSELGPLSTAVLGLAGSLAAATDLSRRRAVMSIGPIALASLALLLRQVGDTGTAGLSSPLALLGFTFLACRSYHSRKTRSSASNLRRTALSFLIAAFFIAALWITGAAPSPLAAISLSLSSLLVLLSITALSRFIPLPFSTSSSLRLERLRTSQEAIAFLLSIVALQLFAFPPIPGLLDLLLILPLAIASVVAHPAYTSKKPSTSTPSSTPTYPSGWSWTQLVPLRWRSHLQTVLNTPSSRRMFYFLLLNLAYMGVQMGYGVITNSLGLISDAIHMLFDCLGLGVGLWASVAATWKPDERYTFGYGRVETLSGFANGCFLILISVFIIFEAIQRVISPPEMHIEQLLPVSSIGLAINLFGMWATGGHHHHGHGHSHGHDHGHGHHHVAVHEKKEDHRHDSHDHEHPHQDHDQSTHSHSHSHSAPTHVRRRSSGLSLSNSPQINLSPKLHHEHDANGPNGHDHNSHDHSHSHLHDDHSHSDCDDHAHHAHEHDHGHSHNMRGVFLHVLADTLGSVGVIVSTILIKYTGWTGFDPIASLFIAALILASVIPLVIDSGRVLCLDVGEEKDAEIRQALADLAAVEGLANYGAPRFWPRSEGEIVGSIHIRLAVSPSSYDPTRFGTPGMPGRGGAIYVNSDKVVARVEKALKSNIKGLRELVVQVEGSEERTYCSCMAGGG